ncbi:beta-lactoglobulin-2-like [Bos javanicus]|uniref:beta-lactoglobulin-2-like n=1 Tax=Bos javanicus TaxID=9906 RepID=UPI002AA8874F|nr:beta-lactoglobulin-2-like [Bos javanicus]
MKCFLLALGLALACGIQAAYIPQMAGDLDIRKLKVPPQVAGMWHTVAMAASNMLLLDAESGPLRVYVEELKPTPEGDLEILLQKRKNHECVEKTLMAQKTEDPAVFTVNCGVPSGQPQSTQGPARRSEVFTILAAGVCSRPEMDDEAMEKFAGALASLLEHVQMVLGLRQGADLRAKADAQEVDT